MSPLFYAVGASSYILRCKIIFLEVLEAPLGVGDVYRV